MSERVSENVQLGKKLGHVEDPRTFKLKKFLKLAEVTPPHESYIGKSEPIRMYANDKYGCCTCAAQAHRVDINERSSGQTEIQLTDADVLKAYSDVTGFNKDDPWTDNGAYMLDVLNYMRTTGMGREKDGSSHTIHAFASLELGSKSRMQWKIASWLFGGIYIGAWLPMAAANQLDAGKRWQLVDENDPTGEPGSWGGHCVAPETQVLTSDLQWKEIADIDIGDELVGFDEFGSISNNRKYRKSIVEDVNILNLPCYDLTFEDGTEIRCSYDHLWQTEWGFQGWTKTEDMRCGTQRSARVRKPLDVTGLDKSWGAGYLAAALDGEGWIDSENKRGVRAFGFAQRPNAMLEQVKLELEQREFNYAERLHSSTGLSDNSCTQLTMTDRRQLVRFLSSVRPPRLIDKFDISRLGTMYGPYVRLVEKQDAGVQSVVAIKTSTNTYIAEGFASHNCMHMVGYSVGSVVLSTWDQRIRANWDWVEEYVDEAYAIVSEDFLNKSGKTRQGFDTNKLDEELAKL